MATGKSAEAIRVFAISILEVSYKEDNGHLSRKNFIDACKVRDARFYTFNFNESATSPRPEGINFG